MAEEVINSDMDMVEFEVISEMETEVQQEATTVDCSIQTSPCKYDSDNLPTPKGLDIHNIFEDSSYIKFLTGLESYNVFMDVFYSLGSASYNLQYLYGIPVGIKSENQLLLTIIKLRLYKTNFELGRLFFIKETEVYNIFVTWVRFMALQWREINLWPEMDIVKFYAPQDFKRKFPQTRVVIDGTEMPVTKPKQPAAQQITFSSYKNRNTSKVSVGATPGGMISYISPAYGGSASDRQITERSNLTRMVEPGNSIMSDKGFNVQDIFAPFDVTINIPTFFRKRNRKNGQTVMSDRQISSKRVHIERLIGNAKTYKILISPLNHTEMVLSSDITFICFMLTNFRNCIVSSYA